MRIRHPEPLGRRRPAGVDHQPGAVRRAPARTGEALAGLRVQQRAVGLLRPHLRAVAVAVVELDRCARCRSAAGDVETTPQRLQRAADQSVGCRPALIDSVVETRPDLHRRAVGPDVVARDIDALAACRIGDRNTGTTPGGARVTDRVDVRLDVRHGRVRH